MNNFSTIFKLQKQAIRTICNLKYNEHTEPFFKKLKILPLPYLKNYFDLQIMFKYKNNLLPLSFNNLWRSEEERRAASFNINLRINNEFEVPFVRLQSSKNSPYCRIPTEWNNFNEHSIKVIVSKSEFSIKLKKFFINELRDSIVCERLLCPRCHLNLRV